MELEVSKLDISKEVNDLHYQKISNINGTFPVLKLDKFKEVKEIQPKNNEIMYAY